MEGPSLGLSPGATENEGELELGLGLSLGGSVKAPNKGSNWGDFGRILTAKDFPNGFCNRAANNNNNNTVAAGGGGGNCGGGGGGVSGTKRAAAGSVSPAREAGSPASTTPGFSQVVGWPPIKTYRMNSLVNQAKSPSPEKDKGVGGDDIMKDIAKNEASHGSKNTNSSGKEIKGHIGFVKVNMDGLAIGRKVDLNSHATYDTLAQALEEMFFKPNATVGSNRGEKEHATKPSKLLDGSSDFVLTYEDKDGDWMLVGDVPWGMFLSTVKRLRIMRTSEANGLAPRFQERNDRQRSRPV